MVTADAAMVSFWDASPSLSRNWAAAAEMQELNSAVAEIGCSHHLLFKTALSRNVWAARKPLSNLLPSRTLQNQTDKTVSNRKPVSGWEWIREATCLWIGDGE